MKKAQVPINLMIGFVLAFVFLSIVFIFVMVLMVVPGFGGVNFNLTVKLNATTTSRICNHDLINFMRATDNETGLEFGQLLAVDADKFKAHTEDYFNSSFQRGDTKRNGWMLLVMRQDLKPIAKIGTLESMPIKESCKQYIPSLMAGDYYIVQLGTEY